MSDYQTAKFYAIRPLAEGIIVALAILIIAMVATYFILHHALIAEKEEISESMQRQAKIIATLVDGDTHSMFVDPNQENTADYKEAIEPLGRALLESCDKKLSDFLEILEPKNGCSLVFVYTAILRDKKVHYILDPWPPDIYAPSSPNMASTASKVQMKSHIMDEYADANAQMYEALTMQEARTTEVYQDDWGHFISAYAPFYNSQNEFVGIVGVDMSAERYIARLKPIKKAAYRAFLVIGIIAYLSGAIVWFLRRFILVVNTKRLTLLDEHKNLLERLKQLDG